MGYRLNCLDEPIFMAVSKPLLTEFGIHLRLESCDNYIESISKFLDSEPGNSCPDLQNRKIIWPHFDAFVVNAFSFWS